MLEIELTIRTVAAPTGGTEYHRQLLEPMEEWTGPLGAPPPHGARVAACVTVRNTGGTQAFACSPFIVWDARAPVVTSMRARHRIVQKWVEPSACASVLRRDRDKLLACAVDVWTNSTDLDTLQLSADIDDEPSGAVGSCLWGVSESLLEAPDDSFIQMSGGLAFELAGTGSHHRAI